MKNLRYTAVETIAFPFRKLLVILLISLIFFESFGAIQIGSNLFMKKRQFERTFAGQQVMHLFDTSFSLTQEAQRTVLQKFEELTQTEFLYYSRFSSQVTAVSTAAFHFQNNPPVNFLLDSGDSASVPQVIEANSAFFKAFPVDLAEGRFFSAEEFQTDSPLVILGSDYQNHYQLGDKINFGRADERFLAGKTDSLSRIDYTIIGFLNPQQQLDLSTGEQSFSYQSLNQQMLLPQNQFYDVLPENNLYQYQLIMSNSQLKAIGMDNINQLLAELNQELSPIHLVLNDSSQQISNQLDILNNQFSQLLIKFFIMLTFASISFFICFKEIIKQRSPVFFVYLSIGSTKQDIILINYLMTMVIITSGFALSFFLNAFFPRELITIGDNQLSLVTLIISYFLFTLWFSLLILPTLWKFKMINISAYLKEVFV